MASRFWGCGCLGLDSAHPHSPPETEDKKISRTGKLRPECNSISSPDLSDYWCGLFLVGSVVLLFQRLFPRNRWGRRGHGGADVGIAEALPLQDVLGVLPLQLAW